MREAGQGPTALRLVIIGGGYTGALLAINAARAGTTPLHITVVEPAADLGRGIAYGTSDPSHRINVPSDRMGLFRADPGQATRWLHGADILPDAASDAGEGHFYVPRHAYGDFMADILRQTIAATAARVTFRHERSEARALARRDAAWTVTLADGAAVTGDFVALCFGHAVPHLPCPIDGDVRSDSKFVLDPWARDALARIEPTDAVLIVGTGLTMADVAVSLLDKGHRGPITAVSRRGLLPRAHGPFLGGIDLFGSDAAPITALGLLRLIRSRIKRDGPAYGGWQPLVDALRFHLPQVWSRLPPREKRQVVRRLLPFWEVHRFRIAPQVAATLEAAMERAALAVEKAGLAGLARRNDRLVATLHRSGGAAEERSFDAVVLCTGPEKDLRRNPLVAALLAEKVARLDDLGMGLAVDPHSHVLDHDGWAWPDLVAFGPMTRGCFGEMTGAPDIAAHLETEAARLFGSPEGTVEEP